MSTKLIFAAMLIGFLMVINMNGQPIVFDKAEMMSNDLAENTNGRDAMDFDKPAAGIDNDLDVSVNDLVADEAKAENALFNYLFAKQLVHRLRERMYTRDQQQQQRKRSYWKQCAFNAVSCFG